MRVVHLVGSAVDPFYADLSRLYAQGCLEATAEPGREDVVAYVAPDRSWRFPDGVSRAAVAEAEPMPVADAIAHLAALAPDVMVPQMFCRPGMTEYRALFDVLGVPYVGNRPAAMALGADKAQAKAVVAAAGVAVPEGELVAAGQSPTLAPPAVVKPVDADNSFGVTLVTDAGAYPAALAAAREHGTRALVEAYVPLGREVRCGVLERDGALLALPLEEYAVDAGTHPIRGYEDKIAPGDDGLSLVAKQDTKAWIVDRADPINGPVQQAARRAHRALGCRHYSLFDFRVDPAGRPFFLEAGLYCSFSPQSVVAVMAAAAGIALPELFADALRAASAPQEVAR